MGKASSVTYALFSKVFEKALYNRQTLTYK
jgi:hypothetical protein